MTPDSTRLYAVTRAVCQVSKQRCARSRPSVRSTGDIAITPDGTRVYVAAGLVYVIDTVTNMVVHAFVAEAASVRTWPTTPSVAISRTARASGSIPSTSRAAASARWKPVLVDTASDTVAGTINLFSLPGAIALTPDGSRAYVGIQSHWVNTGYGAGFLPDAKFTSSTRSRRASRGHRSGSRWAQLTQQIRPPESV